MHLKIRRVVDDVHRGAVVFILDCLRPLLFACRTLYAGFQVGGITRSGIYSLQLFLLVTQRNQLRGAVGITITSSLGYGEALCNPQEDSWTMLHVV